VQRADDALYLLAMLTFLDEASGSILHRLELVSSSEMLVVDELMARRVRDEVAAYNGTPFRRASTYGAAHQIGKSAQRLLP